MPEAEQLSEGSARAAFGASPRRAQADDVLDRVGQDEREMLGVGAVAVLEDTEGNRFCVIGRG